MNINQLFKRVKGFDEYGRRTAYSLRQSGVWKEMEQDIWCCTSQHELLKCRLYWAAKVVEDKWPDYHIELANNEFDEAVKALAALQATHEETNHDESK